jgi:hypothetical protein
LDIDNRIKNLSKFRTAEVPNSFQCPIFALKSVQNRKYFCRSSQNYFVLALYS